MRQDYFYYNNHRYNAEDLIPFLFFDAKIAGSYRTNVKFLYYDTETKEYFIEVYGKNYNYSEDLFYKCLRRASKDSFANITKEPKPHTFSDEMKIIDLKIAWVLYIFALFVCSVLYDRILAWLFVSIVFFSYRSKILKEYGYR